MNEEQRKRRNRVNRLKKMILALVAAMILIPTALCIFFAVRTYSLNKACEVLRNTEKQLLLDNHSLQEQYEEVSNELAELKASPEVVYQVITEEPKTDDNVYSPEEMRKVYLTFDDGPSTNTARILDILKQYNVKATFFVVGKTEEQYLPLYKRIVEEGHTLGMHSYSHKYNEIYRSVDAYAKDLEALQEFLLEQTGVECKFVRFPGGSSNTVSSIRMNDCIDYVTQKGITYFDWNVSSGDAVNSYISADRIVSNCEQGILPCQTAVVLLHDAAEKRTTVDALPELIERISAMENTVLLPIDSDTRLVQHIQNESED